MAKAYNARCLVIKHTKLGETDMIVTMLAEDGHQIRAVAKGLRKPGNRLGARLDLFSEADLLINEGKSLDIVREARTVSANEGIRDGLERSAAAHVQAELIDKLGRDGVVLGERMFDMSSAAFRLASSLESRQAPLMAATFLFKAMAMQGFAPAVRECALCGAPVEEVRSFDIGYGGVLCEECESGLGICTTTAPWLATWVDSMLYCTFAQILETGNYPAAEILDLAHMWVREHAGFDLKSMSFLKSLLLDAM